MYRTFRKNVNPMEIIDKDSNDKGYDVTMFQGHNSIMDFVNNQKRRTGLTDNSDNIIHPMKVLLLFPNHCFQISNLELLCNSRDIVCDSLWSFEGALFALQNNVYDLFVCDRRSYDCNMINIDELVSTIRRQITNPKFPIISFDDRVLEDYSALWELGYNEHWFNYDNSMALKNYLYSYFRNQFSSSVQLRNLMIIQNIFDKLSDCIEILDEDFNIETVNNKFHKQFKTKANDVIGFNWFVFHQIPTEKIASILHEIRVSKKSTGILSIKNEEPDSHVSHLNVKIKALVSGKNQYVVYIKYIKSHHLKEQHSDVMSSFDGDASLGTYNKNREPFLSRSQIAIESPILKIMKIINSIQDSATPIISTQLQKIVEILSSNDLFITTVDSMKADIMSSNLIDGLLSNNATIFAQTENRRHSSAMNKRRQTRDNSETIHDHINQVLAKISKLPEMPETESTSAIDKLLEEHQSWSFDILRLEALTECKALRHIGMKIFTHFDLAITLNIDMGLFQNWLYVIESNYKDSNAYHNSTHAADVLQSSAWFLERLKVKDIFDSYDDAISIIAAIIHDLDHPGRTNPFLINSNANLAVLYNDIAVLENHHVSYAFKLTLKDDRINIFKGLSSDDYRVVRHGIIDAVLATEMAKHFEHLTKFVNTIWTINDFNCTTQLSNYSENMNGTNMQDSYILSQAPNKAIIRRMLIKCSDVNNPTRPFRLSEKWANRISEEYFSQTDQEIEMNIPVVMPQFNRQTCNIPQSQITFIELFLESMFAAWSSFADTEELVTNLRENKAEWKAKAERDKDNMPTINEK